MATREIVYRTDVLPSPEEIIELFKDTGLPRPVGDPVRIKKMFENASLIVTAWDSDQLVGLARTLTDYSWCSYLSDLAVNSGYQKWGIGRELIRLTKEMVGAQSMLLLLSVPEAMDYYPHIGFEKQDNCFLIHRTQ